jgi:hypothetical protein
LAAAAGRVGVIAVGLLLASQALDAAGYVLATGHGTELNPLIAVGFPAIVAAKLGVAAAVGVFLVLAHRERWAAGLALIGCAGCLSELVAALP